MIQCRNRSRFPLETSAEFFLRNLDRDIPPETRIASAVNLAHAARTYWGQDLVRSQPIAERERHPKIIPLKTFAPLAPN
jgi:hypothetical protein